MAAKSNKGFEQNLSAKQIHKRLLLIFSLVVVCLFIVLPPTYINKVIGKINTYNIGVPKIPDKKFNFGLDLRGGAHLVYRAKTDQIPSDQKTDSVDSVKDVIERRVRGGLGVTEPVVQTTHVGDDYRIIVELPGVTNVNEAIQMIGETPILEFKEQNLEPPRELTKEEKKQLADFNAAANKKALTVVTTVKKGMNFADAVNQYSEDATSTKSNGEDVGFITRKSEPELYSWAESVKNGDTTSKPISTPIGYIIAKRLEEKVIEGEKTVSLAHLLLCYQGASRCEKAAYTKEEAKKKLEDIKKEITPKNFTELVKKYSTEPEAKERGGELGVVEKGDLVPEFEKVAWEMPVESISDIVETEFGFHLIYKKAETPVKEYRLARILIKTKQESDIVPPVGEWKSTNLSGKQLKHSEVVQDPRSGEIQVSLNFNEEGAKLFGDITTRNVGKQIAIFLDQNPISIAGVDEPILSGSAVIRGQNINNIVVAKELVKQLNLGALPVPVELLSQKKVDATLGEDSLNKSFKAGVYGLIAIMIFMIIYYRLPGLLSVFSLAYYALLSLAFFKLIGVTLTLSGIAGFILSIGMAVDANILVFERLKEELKQGKNLRSAIEEAFLRSWPSIRDGHITALISCVFLLWFGSGFVKGFAAILALGTLINLFTAITVTRTIMRFIFKKITIDKAHWLFLGSSTKKNNNESTV